MNNFEIIVNDAVNGGFISLEEVEDRLANGDDIPFHTFNEWKKLGMVVKRGEHALYISRIWDKKYYNKIKEWRLSHDESDEEMPRPWKTNAYIFGEHQVQALEENSEKVKMEKGEVSEKQTRKADKPKAEKVAKTTRKGKKAVTQKQKLAKVKAEEKAVAETTAVSPTETISKARQNYENMVVGQPITVSFENKSKKTRKTETAKAESVKADTRKPNGKYTTDYYVMTRDGAKAVKGCPIKNSKIKGLFCRREKDGNKTEYIISDIKSGMYVKSDRKLKDLLAWLNTDEVVARIKDARKSDNYKKTCVNLKNAIATAKA